MKDRFKNLLTQVTGLVKESAKLIKSRYMLHTQAYHEKEKVWKQNALNMRVYEVMQECAIDLYEALGSQSYPCLQRIVNPQSFRYYDYKIVNGMVVYRFTLSKQSLDRLPSVIVDNLRDKMNSDIASRSHYIASYCGMDYLFAYFPILANGIYIVSISDGGADILITVASHYQPYSDLLF